MAFRSSNSLVQSLITLSRFEVLGQRSVFALGPFCRLRVGGVSESVVGVVLKRDCSGGHPLGMLLREAFPRKRFQLQLLSLAQLHNEDVLVALIGHSFIVFSFRGHWNDLKNGERTFSATYKCRHTREIIIIIIKGFFKTLQIIIHMQ